MNRVCGNIYPNSFGLPIRIQLPLTSNVYGRDSIYCRYQIISLEFDTGVSLNVTHIVYYYKYRHQMQN